MMNKMFTKNGHDLFDISSLLQKSIRRSDHVMAGYAANEIYGRYRNYFWKRMLTISAEDCWGVVTKEIIALREADEIVNKQSGGYDTNPLFIAKALVLLLKARKNRDGDYFACNLLNSNKTKTDEEIQKWMASVSEKPVLELPDYTFDCHTSRGKAKGKTKADMIKDEQEALTPYQKGDFDNLPWDSFFENQKIGFDKDKGFPTPTKQQLKELEKGDMLLF